jgi:uncharacterized glyoxalase superfamily metalloenzyme YdcJ
LDRNPFRVFTSMLAPADARFFDADLRPRVERFIAARRLFDPDLIARARVIATDGGCDANEADDFVPRRPRYVRCIRYAALATRGSAKQQV